MIEKSENAVPEEEAEETTDRTDTAAEDQHDVAEKPPSPEDKSGGGARWRSRRLWLSGVAVAVACVIAASVYGYLKYSDISDQLAATRQVEADRATAVQLAKDYALKSLTYSYKDPDAFFASVKEGVAPALRDKYINATDLLKGIMLQAQVTSKGEILATEAIEQPGDVYQVVVAASQTTRNVQHPQERVSLILLQITLNKTGDAWQVSDIGPKTGTQAPDAGSLPPAPSQCREPGGC